MTTNYKNITIETENGITKFKKETDVDADGIEANLETISYDLLELYYGGWEINEGSSGEIVITNDSLIVDHYWNKEEWDTIGLDIKVTADTLD